jgi:O-antigen/teichoic acid export membrane protein
MTLRAIFGPALVYAVTSAAGAAVPLLILPIMTRVLSPEEYGLVAMFSVMVTIFGAIAGLSVHGAVGVRYFQRERWELPRYVTGCLFILAGSILATLLVVAPLAPVLERITKIPPRWLLVAVLIAGCQFVIQIRLVLWQSATRPWAYGALRIAQALIDAGLSLAFVLGLMLGWQGRVAGIGLAVLATALIAFVALHRGGWLGARPDRAYVIDALKFGVPLIPHAVGWMLLVMVDRFMISNLIDVASTGIYTVALQIGMVLWMAIESFNKAFSPWLMKGLVERHPQRDREIVRSTYAAFMVIVLAAVLLGVSAPWFLPLVVGPDFQGAAPLVVYMTIGYAFTGMYTLVGNYVYYAGWTLGLSAISFIAGLLNVAASYWLLRHNGVIGAAQAFALSQAVVFAGTWWLAQRCHPMPWRSVLARDTP